MPVVLRGPYNARMSSEAIELQALKADSFGRIALMRDARGLFVRRDLAHVPLWLRLPAWWLARREARGLQRVLGAEAVPQLLNWDGRRLDRSYLDGAAMYQRPPHGALAYFRLARRRLQALHRCGFAHNDLAKEANWLVLADVEGRAAIDWGIYGAPETFLVDAEGMIRWKHIGALPSQQPPD